LDILNASSTIRRGRRDRKFRWRRAVCLALRQCPIRPGRDAAQGRRQAAEAGTEACAGAGIAALPCRRGGYPRRADGHGLGRPGRGRKCSVHRDRQAARGAGRCRRGGHRDRAPGRLPAGRQHRAQRLAAARIKRSGTRNRPAGARAGGFQAVAPAGRERRRRGLVGAAHRRRKAGVQVCRRRPTAGGWLRSSARRR